MDEDPTLSVGAILGGAGASRAWERAVKSVALRLDDIGNDHPGGPVAVNVVFQVPGELMTPDFEGIRTGRYWQKKARLVVQVALPEDVPDDPDLYVRERLAEAVEVAREFLQKKGFPGESLETYSSMIGHA